MDNLPRNAEEYRCWWTEQRPDIPYGLCWCGCGESTPLAPQSNSGRQRFIGEPFRYAAAGHHLRKSPVQYIEEDRGYKTPCWIWQRTTNWFGHGMLKINGKRMQAHRYFYEQAYGPVPEGLEPDHLCRVPPCCRPDHLEAVTHKENIRRAKHVKLSVKKAHEIRRLAQKGYTHRALATRFGVGKSTISSVIWGRTWT